MTPGVELVLAASPLVGSGVVLFFMRRGERARDQQFSDLKKGLADMAQELKAVTYELTKRVTWEKFDALKERLDDCLERLSALEARCNVNHAGGRHER